MPNRHLQRPQMDESVAVGRETLEERGRTPRGRASRPALVSRASRAQVRLLVVLLVDGPVSAQQGLVLARAVGGGMLRVSTESQTSATRRCCDCDPRQYQTREQGRRASGQSLGSKCSRRERTPVSSCCPGRLRKGTRYRTLADSAHAAWEVSNYMREEGDLGGRGAPLV
jgi:hypothetical protein